MLATVIRTQQLLITLALSICLSAGFNSGARAQDNAPDQPPPESSQDSSDKDDEPQEKTDSTEPNKTDSDGKKSETAGLADLDKAIELRISVTSTRDLDRIADLCESAIEQGLDDESMVKAKALWSSVLFDHAGQLNLRIAPKGVFDTRWRWLRSQAISRLEKAIELSPGKVDALILLAKLHSLDAGDREAAIEAIEKAIAQITDDKEKLSEALYIRARLAEDETAQIADLTQAVKINPKNVEALMQRAMHYLKQEKTNEAMADFKSLLEIDSKNVDRFGLIAQELRQRELLAESITILDMALKVDAENEDLLFMRAQTHLANESTDLAVSDLNKVLEIDRQNTDALNLRARIYITKDEFDKALADANELIQQQPDSDVGLALRSLIYRAQRNLDKAIADVEALLAKDSDNLDYQFDLAILLNANEEPTRAIPYFDTVLRALAVRMETEQLQTELLRSRGDAWLSLGNHEKAVDDYELALDLLDSGDASSDEPEDKERYTELKSGILNNLSWVLSTSKIDEVRDGQRALKLATEASELTEYKAAFILSTLASGYAETGDFENARKWAAKAVELAESDEQRVGLQDELDSYKNDKPWREMENVEEEKKKKELDQDSAPQSENKSNSDSPSDEDKPSDDGGG